MASITIQAYVHRLRRLHMMKLVETLANERNARSRLSLVSHRPTELDTKPAKPERASPGGLDLHQRQPRQQHAPAA